MADVKLSALNGVSKLVDGLVIPVSLQEGAEGAKKWKTKKLTTSASDFADYTYAGVLGKLKAGDGINIASDFTISTTLDTTVARVVDALPVTGEEHKIYLVKSTVAGAEAENNYIEWMWVNKGTAGEPAYSWEKLDEFKLAVDLEPINTELVKKYVKPDGGIPKDDLADAVQTSLGKADSAIQEADLEPYAKTAEVNSAITTATKISNSYNVKSHADSHGTVVSVAKDDTFEVAISKLEQAILDNELVVAEAVGAIVTATGIKKEGEDTINYSKEIGPEENKETLHSISEAIDKLFVLMDTKQDSISDFNKLAATLVAVDDSHRFVSDDEKSTWSGKQNAISDLATIRSNAEAGKAANDALNPTEGVTYDALKAEVAALESANSTLEGKVAALEQKMADFVARFEYSRAEGATEATWGKEFLVVDNEA